MTQSPSVWTNYSWLVIASTKKNILESLTEPLFSFRLSTITGIGDTTYNSVVVEKKSEK